MSALSSPSTQPTGAAEATVYLPDPFHSASEEYALKRFKRVIRPADGSREECMGLADGICESMWLWSGSAVGALAGW
jgi:hypothetical protein